MAINFPSTAGQATDGSYTYNVAGIVYAWNGSSWEAAGAGASATDRTLFSVTTNSAGSAALSYNNTNGVFSYTPPDLSSYLTAEADTLASVTARGSQTNTGVYFPDGIKATFGAASPNTELEIYRDVGGINSYISDVGSGDLRITTNAGSSIELMKDTSETLAKFNADGSCELRYDNTTRLETTNTGVTITGALTAGGLTYPNTNGTSGQVLASDGTNTNWVNAGTLTAGAAAEIGITAVDTDSSYFITFVDSSTGNDNAKVDTNLTYNPNSNTLSAGTFSGSFSGNGSNLNTLNASELDSGTVDVNRLGSSGTRNSTTFLRGDNTWQVVDTSVSVTQTSYSGTNPITTSGSDITIGTASNAYGRRTVSTSIPTTGGNDGDIVYVI